MDADAALVAGLVAGLVIAMQVGAVSLLLVETAVAAGPRAGVAAGMGVATADLGFAAVAAAGGGAAGAALSRHEPEIKLIAAAVLAALAIHGLVALLRRDQAAGRSRRPRAARAHYAGFLAITTANPLTIVSFAAVAASLSLDGPGAAAAFAGGVGAASAGWHLALSLTAGRAGRWLTPRAFPYLSAGGRLLVLAIAAHLALTA
ncbi:MAG TPA: LysE family transporter [Thermoleophilaceae bacterium]|nr:LysE family transporter [Thermoleophilaceae bacterium]